MFEESQIRFAQLYKEAVNNLKKKRKLSGKDVRF